MESNVCNFILDPMYDTKTNVFVRQFTPLTSNMVITIHISLFIIIKGIYMFLLGTKELGIKIFLKN